MKTVGDLINELKKYDRSLPVYVFADHGQTFIQAGETGLEYTEDYTYYAEAMDWDDLEGTELSFVVVGD